MATLRRLAPYLVLAFTTAACSGAAEWVETAPDVAARARQDPQSFHDAAQAQWDGFDAMVGSYRVRASRGISSRTVDAQIHMFRDRFIDIQMLAPTGQTEGYLAAGRREIGLWTSEENYLYRGANQPGAFGRALGIDLTPGNVVAVLMGYAVPSASDADAVARWDDAERRIRVDGVGVQAWLHPLYARYERVVVATADGPIEVRYEEWTAEGPPVPLRMRVHVSAEDITLELRLSNGWSANPRGLDEAYFDIQPVRGAVEVSLDQLAIDGGLLRRGLER